MILADLYQRLRLHVSASDARYMLQQRTGVAPEAVIVDPRQSVDETAVLSDLKRHRQGVPLSRIYGEREFWGMTFRLCGATLDPRPATETLVAAAVERYRDRPPARILDLGTGCGCILLALLAAFPAAKGVGVDLSPAAVKTAKINAARHRLERRAAFIRGNWGESIGESFDLVVTNPPYIAAKALERLDESVKNYDPLLALAGGEDGLQAYREIFPQLFHLLKPGGRALFEIGFDQEKSTRRLGEELRLSLISTYADLAGHTRVLELAADHRGGDK